MADQSTGGFLSPFLQRERVRSAIPELSGDVLDVGCGNGAIAGLVHPDNYLGIDVDHDTINKARRAFPSHRFELTTKNKVFANITSSFDTIVMLAVLEHVSEPAEFLSAARRVLLPNGRIVVTTPHPAFGWVHALGARCGVFSREAHDEHERLLGPRVMTCVANSAGLRVAASVRFLCGANQLFVLTRDSEAKPLAAK